MKEFKITFKNQLFTLQDLIAVTLCALLIILVLIYYNYLSDADFLTALTYTSIILFLIFYLPVIILHINYLRNGEKYVIIQNQEIRIKEQVIEESGILSIDIYATNHHFRDLSIVPIAFLPYTMYYYYVYIRLKDGRVFFLNSLLGYKLDKNLIDSFPNISINKNIVFYPYI